MIPPAPCPGPAKRSKRVYVYWAIALALLMVTGIVCWRLVVPYLQVRAAVKHHLKASTVPVTVAEIKRLGGPAQAAGRLHWYLGLPKAIAPHRRDAVMLLGHCEEHARPAVPDLLAILQDKDEDTGLREWTAFALGETRDPRAVPALAAALSDEHDGVRVRAAHALGRIGDRRAVEPLIAAWDEGRGLYAAAEALADLGDLRAVQPLIAGLKRERPEDVLNRIMAAHALGKLRDPRAVEPLIGVLGRDLYLVRRVAAQALGRIGDPRAVPALKQAVAARDSRLRLEARQALCKILGVSLNALTAKMLLEGLNVKGRVELAEQLGNAGVPEAAELLETLRKDEDERVREAASTALEKIRVRQMTEQMMRSLK